jgi:hypothetical protein
MDGEDEDEDEESVQTRTRANHSNSCVVTEKKMVHLILSEKSQRNKRLCVMKNLQLIVVYK